MKKYKFHLKQEVYIINDPYLKNDYQKCVVRSRKIIDRICYYQLSGISYSVVNSFKLVFKKEILDIGIRNFPRTDNWLQEDAILEQHPEEEIEVCSKNGCELVNDLLEGNNIIDINPDEETKKEIKQLKKLIYIKEIEMQILKDIFRESIDKLEHEQNKHLYQKACLERDESGIKGYLLDAIE